jgi:hypothetical protein
MGGRENLFVTRMDGYPGWAVGCAVVRDGATNEFTSHGHLGVPLAPDFALKIMPGTEVAILDTCSEGLNADGTRMEGSPGRGKVGCTMASVHDALPRHGTAFVDLSCQGGRFRIAGNLQGDAQPSIDFGPSY